MLINIEEIQENDWNPNSMTELKFNALVKGIKNEKWNRLFPLEVLPKDENWKYVVIDWAHRLRALKEAGIKQAHVEISDLKDWYDKLQTIAKNSIHWTHDQVQEAQLVAEIKRQGITDSEIMASIGIDEKELIAIDNLWNFSLEDFEEDNDIDISEPEEEEEEERKEITLELSEAHYEILEALQESAKTLVIQDAILIAAYYFQSQMSKGEIDGTLLKLTKEILFWPDSSYIKNADNFDF